MSVIYNFEDNWCASALTICAANNVGVATVALMTPRCAITASTPRIEFHGMGLSRQSDQMVFAPGLVRWVYSDYGMELQTAIFTDRIQGQNHQLIVGKVRYLYAIESQKFVTPAVSYYELMDIIELEPEVSKADDDRQDITILKHRLRFSILPDAPSNPDRFLGVSNGDSFITSGGSDIIYIQVQ
jgi:hypothetical protein